MWLIAEVDTPEVKYTNIFPLSIYSIIPEAAPDGTPYNSARVLVNTAIGNDMGRLRLQFFRENNYSRLIFVYDDGSRGVIEYTAYEGAYAYETNYNSNCELLTLNVAYDKVTSKRIRVAPQEEEYPVSMILDMVESKPIVTNAFKQILHTIVGDD